MSILIVDDDKNFRRSLAVGLEETGLRVHESGSGMDALEFLQLNQQKVKRVESVIVDAKMPGLDGFWLTDQLRALYPQLKVVILSAHSYPSLVDKYTLLEKPVDVEQLAVLLRENAYTSTE